MHKFALRSIKFFGLCGFLAWSATAPAMTISINPISQGWIDQAGNNSGVSADGNYFAGNCGLGTCRIGEYRNYFNFTLPLVSGPISSARFEFNTFDIATAQNPNITYGMFSTSSIANFADLGTGVEYGEMVFSGFDSGQWMGIDLSSAALDDIFQNVGSAFSISGRVISPTSFGPDQSDQFLFGYSESRSSITLKITYGEPELPVSNYDQTDIPATPTHALLVMGLAGLGWARRRRV